MLHELICYKGSHGVRHGVTFCAQPNFTAPLPGTTGGGDSLFMVTRLDLPFDSARWDF